MKQSFVVDASVGFSWVYPDQASAYTEGVLTTLDNGATALVPTLWPIEIANAVLVAVRRRRMTNAEADAAFDLLKRLEVTVDSDAPSLAFGSIAAMAQEQSLSAYDACYLELAARKAVAIATRDEALMKAARKCGVKILDPS